ncbi:hypothetical protein ACHAW6_009952, partial [Cyclotella cf. meneghiniana]
VGVNLKRTCDGTYKFTQCTLIHAIIDDINIGNSYIKQVQAKLSFQLYAFLDSQKYWSFNYCSVVGKLNYLSQSTRSDILYALHQITKYSANPRFEHGETIMHVVKYLKATRHGGLCFKPNPSKGFQCYCNNDCAGNWNKGFVATDTITAKSRSG